MPLHLARVCNTMVQQQSSKWHFGHKMHKDDVNNLQHSIDIVNEKYDLKLKQNMKEIIIKVYDENKGSLARTIVFTIGHFLIAATILKILDPGIELWVAVTDAIVEPLVNSVWYYILDKWWVSKSKKRKAT